MTRLHLEPTEPDYSQVMPSFRYDFAIIQNRFYEEVGRAPHAIPPPPPAPFPHRYRCYVTTSGVRRVIGMWEVPNEELPLLFQLTYATVAKPFEYEDFADFGLIKLSQAKAKTIVRVLAPWYWVFEEDELALARQTTPEGVAVLLDVFSQRNLVHWPWVRKLLEPREP